METSCEYYDLNDVGEIVRVCGPVSDSELIEHLDYDLPITKRVLDAIR